MSSGAENQAFQAAQHYREAADARHYRVTNDEWLLAWEQLRPAEIKVLYYLRTLDPWGDRNLEIGVTDIAKVLKCNKGTVSRALRTLDRGGWITLEISTATVRLHTKSNASNQVLSTDNGVAARSQALSTDNTRDRQTTPEIARQHLASETVTEQGSQIALNSLKLNKQTTHLDGDESGVSVSVVQEELEPSVQDRSVAPIEKQDSGSQPEPIEEDQNIAPAILSSVKKLGVNIEDRQLRRAMAQYPDRVADAIASLQEKANRVQSPTRFLVRAIQEGWQPETPRPSKAVEGFSDWYRQAYDRYLACASQRIDGILKVLMACDEWIPFSVLQPLSWDEITARFGDPSQQCHVA